MEMTFTTISNKLDLDWLKVELSKKYELKDFQRLGPGATDDKELMFLNSKPNSYNEFYSGNTHNCMAASLYACISPQPKSQLD